MEIVGDLNSLKYILGFAMLPGEEEVIFQTISNQADGENYQY